MNQAFHDMIAHLLPDPQERESFFALFQKPLKKSLTLVTSRMDPQRFAAYADQYDWILTSPSLSLDKTWYVDRKDREIALWKTLLHLIGVIYLQEVAASIPATQLDVPSGGLVLDMCAAPWGKSIQLAQQDCLVWSNDVSRARLAALTQNIQRTSSYNTVVSNYDGQWFGEHMPQSFDAILLDAPCSGEGTSFKSSSAYDRWHASEITKIAWLQWELVQSALAALAVGGELVYSTCTLNTQENEAIVARLCQEYPECELLETSMTGVSPWLAFPWLSPQQSDQCMRCRPHRQKTGWFFVSRFRKNAPIKAFWQNVWQKTSPRIWSKKRQKSDFSFAPKLQKHVWSFLEQWGIQPDDHHFFVQYGKDVFVTHQRAKDIMHHKLYQAWIPCLRQVRDGYTLHHGAGTVFGHRAQDRVIDLTHDQALDYTHHKELQLEKEHGEYMLRREWIWIWVTKIVNGMTKNRFMKW